MTGCQQKRVEIKSHVPSPLDCKDCNIVIISLSSFNTAHSTLYGYKKDTDVKTAEWMKNAVIFDNHFATSYWAFQSNMTLFTGLQPYNHKVLMSKFHNNGKEDVLDKKIPTLPQELQSAGYKTLSFSGSPHGMLISPSAGFGKGFDHNSFLEVQNTADLNVLDGWMDKVSDKKFFAYISSVRLHFSYYITPEFAGKKFKEKNYKGKFPQSEADYEKKYAQYTTAVLKEGAPDAEKKIRPIQFLKSTLNPQDPKDIEFLNNTYDQALQYTDTFVDHIFNYLKNKKILDKTIVILTSDMGQNLLVPYNDDKNKVSFSPLASEYPVDAVTRIPLMIYLPSREKAQSKMMRITNITNTTDILPTILGISGLGLSSPTDGINLLPVIAGTSTTTRTTSQGYAYRSEKENIAYVRDEEKILVSRDGILEMVNAKTKKFEELTGATGVLKEEMIKLKNNIQAKK